MEEKNGSWEALLSDSLWFLAGFFGLMLLFVVFQPIFFADLIEPFWDWFGLHNAAKEIADFAGFLYRDFFLFFVFALVLIFWFSIAQKKPEEKKEAPKK